MKVTRHAASRRRRTSRRGPWTTATAALAATGVLLCLVMALRPDGGSDPGRTVAAPAADAPSSTARQKPSRSPSPSPSPSPSSATPTATSGASPSKTPAATPGARASASDPARAVVAEVPSAGRIRPGVTYRGLATHYDAGDGDGACLFGPSDGLMIAAMNHTDYETSKACGAYIRVRAVSGASVTVKVTNECPLPCAPGQLDLSKQAFAKLGALSAGELSITWSLLSPSTSDTVAVRYKTGSTQYWCGIQVVGHRNPVARLEVRADGAWRPLPRAEFNYFLSEQGTGCGGALRITDIYGEQLQLDGIPVRADVLQPTGVQFRQH
ncbi:expansin EXLX1 family cellulose-binding protein [Streptomyces sp. NPDC058335]|uniref:expansin EXLX1 family cellulose-binding protein n=1 Tax=Streptomyces sp. NPDC058335 TaxID=3346451 RepID=UPI00364C3E38